jgi:hypothetical protein
VSNDGVAGSSKQKVRSYGHIFRCEIRQHSVAPISVSELFKYNCNFASASVLPRTTNPIISLKKSRNNIKAR